MLDHWNEYRPNDNIRRAVKCRIAKLATGIEAGQPADVAGMKAYSWIQTNAQAAIDTQDRFPK